mmetsp:Transcript_13299/g.49373  ORF Transcript_13299/g.49373 Transcript_13299/m.49373 type:complete len:385 (-) Transcript_13299:1314-2468(-)
MPIVPAAGVGILLVRRRSVRHRAAIAPSPASVLPRLVDIHDLPVLSVSIEETLGSRAALGPLLGARLPLPLMLELPLLLESLLLLPPLLRDPLLLLPLLLPLLLDLYVVLASRRRPCFVRLGSLGLARLLSRLVVGLGLLLRPPLHRNQRVRLRIVQLSVRIRFGDLPLCVRVDAHYCRHRSQTIIVIGGAEDRLVDDSLRTRLGVGTLPRSVVDGCLRLEPGGSALLGPHRAPFYLGIMPIPSILRHLSILRLALPRGAEVRTREEGLLVEDLIPDEGALHRLPLRRVPHGLLSGRSERLSHRRLLLLLLLFVAALVGDLLLKLSLLLRGPALPRLLVLRHFAIADLAPHPRLAHHVVPHRLPRPLIGAVGFLRRLLGRWRGR